MIDNISMKHLGIAALAIGLLASVPAFGQSLQSTADPLWSPPGAAIYEQYRNLALERQNYELQRQVEREQQRQLDEQFLYQRPHYR